MNDEHFPIAIWILWIVHSAVFLGSFGRLANAIWNLEWSLMTIGEES